VSDAGVPLPLELLELLHPEGEVGRRVVVLDAAAPDAPEPCDLLVVARRAELPAADELADDGLAYVFAPPWERVRLLRLLARRGLRPAAAFVHVRGADELLVQLDRRAMTYAVAAPVALAGGPREAAALTLVEGVPASTALGRGAADVDAVVERVAGWLTRWNVATAVSSVASERLLENELVAHVRLLEPHVREGVAYREWLEQRAAEAVGSRLPLVTAHLDLTMANVLLTPSGKIAVVDWVQSRAEYLPLVDLFYAAVDAAAAADAYRDRVQAFRTCFGAGTRAVAVQRQELTLTRALDVAAPVRELCFHACWLHHAANEFRASGGEPGPFRGIVEVLAARAATAARSV